nr:MAG TPA: hypothetical protein [Bacteriophage sp.]
MEKYVIDCAPEQLELLKKLAAENIEVEVSAKGQTPLNIDRALVIIKNIQAQIVEDIKKLDSRLTGRKAITLYHAITYKYLNKIGYRFSRGAKSLSKLKYFKKFENEIGTRQTLHNYIKNYPIDNTDKQIFRTVEIEIEKAFISARFLS